MKISESLFQEERLNSIVEMIAHRGRVTVRELAETFSISLVTVRKDLTLLEEQGRILRTHGGAISSEEMENHVMFEKRKIKNKSKKSEIGKLASSLVSSGDIIFIDASTTTAEMCSYLTGIRNLTILTNSIEVAYTLGGAPDFNLVILGGDIKKETLSVIDSTIEQTFSRWQLDKAFFGGWGFSIKDGMTDVPGVLIHQKKVIASKAIRKIGLIDSTKIGKGSLATFIPCEELDYLITNRDVSREFVESMDKTAVNLMLA